MAAELQAPAPAAMNSPIPRKRKATQGKGKKKPNKKLKPVPKPKNPTQKMKKIFKKRVRDYNSDDEEEKEEDNNEVEEEEIEAAEEEGEEGDLNADQKEFQNSEDDDDDDGGRGGVTMFNEGCQAFRTAFLHIMKRKLPKDPLGPILSAQKSLVAEKLLEEDTEHKAKGVAKKEKQLAGEKGHVKPKDVLDPKERNLIRIATKGVVKLFNAVNKAQNPQKALNPSKSKDAKELGKLRKQTFLSEIKKSETKTMGNPSPYNSSKVSRSAIGGDGNEPGWAPLRDGYMLTDSKLKDWDKMPDPATVVDQGTMPSESSSDED